MEKYCPSLDEFSWFIWFACITKWEKMYVMRTIMYLMSSINKKILLGLCSETAFSHYLNSLKELILILPNTTLHRSTGFMETSKFLHLPLLLFFRTLSPWPCRSCQGRSCTYHPRVHPYCAASLSVSKELCFLSFWPHRTSALSTAARHPAACHPGPPALDLVS